VTSTEPLPPWARDRVAELTGRLLPESSRIIRDTSEFMAIDRDSVVELGGELFLVTGTERERRFGLAGEPKFWVKRALALGSGSRHILKMVFTSVSGPVSASSRSFACGAPRRRLPFSIWCGATPGT